MMSSVELEQTLLRLGLSQTEAAQLLSVTPRTMRRWVEGEEIPGPAEQTFRAWLRLHERNLAWRPDSESIMYNDQDQITRHRAHAISLSDMLDRVQARGGVRVPWVVDRKRAKATLGPMEVGFYTLLNGGFSLSTYRRTDGDADVDRDRELIEDAAYCIAKALADSGPVTLVYQNRPWRSGTQVPTHETFPSLNAALQRACALTGTEGFHEPFIMAGEPSLSIMDKLEVRRECERRKETMAALRTVAEYVHAHQTIFVRQGPQMLSPQQTASTVQRIKALGDEIASLADAARQGEAEYRQFEIALGELHKLGFFPATSLVSDVARAFLRA